MTPDEATTLILQLEPIPSRSILLRALRDSLRIPDAEQTAEWAHGAPNLAKRLRYPPKTLKLFGVCITRRGTRQFLRALDYSPSSIDLEYRMARWQYKRLFRHDPVMSGNAFVYTYGEAIALLRGRYRRLDKPEDELISTLGYAEDQAIYLPTGVIIPPELNEDLIKHTKRHPGSVYDLTPRKFEELIAAIFKHFGYDVELTPPIKDGGYDIIAVKHSELTGSQVYLIECKRYAPEQKVGVGVVRALYGVVTSMNATKGILTTSSSFTRGAKEFAGKNSARLTLHDLLSLKQWVSEIE